MKWPDFFDHLRENKFRELKIYCQQLNIRKYLPDLRSDFTVPAYIPAEKLIDSTLFIGSANIRTSIHFDRSWIDNLFVMIRGHKRFRLLAPEMTEFL